MRPSAAYTCQRCLGALKGSQAGMRTTLASRRPGLDVARRSISTKNGNDGKAAAAAASYKATSKPLGARTVSTFTPSGGSETAQVQTPPGVASNPPGQTTDRPLLMPNNLFHPYSSSPSPEIRRRAAFMKQNAYCPHPDHHQTRLPTDPSDPESRKTTGHLPPAHVSFECPDCGIPVSCSEEHWADDYEAHLEICDTLREINEDDHDLRSGRFFPEFEYPSDQIEEALPNMTNWDTLLYSREFNAINDERSMRQATRLLTYPLTIGSILHELSPYSIRGEGKLTPEGLKSLSGK